MITQKDVQHIAKLSRLEFNAQQQKQFEQELNQIVNYVNQLQSVDTSTVESKLNCVNAQTSLRNDQPRTFFTQDEAVANAPEKRAGAFFVPPVME